MIETRRKFLTQSSVFATFAISGTKSSGKIIGANERVNVAVCGIKGRGASHIGGHGRQKNVTISHLVDPDSRLFEGRKKFVQSKFKNTPKCVQDVRKVLDNKEVDVISIATPNHWHSLMSIWACQAEKDVYVEKPLSHNLFEGRKLVEAAKSTNASFSTAPKTDPFVNGPISRKRSHPAKMENWKSPSAPVISGVVP
jgi:hypothetical protein